MRPRWWGTLRAGGEKKGTKGGVKHWIGAGRGSNDDLTARKSFSDLDWSKTKVLFGCEETGFIFCFMFYLDVHF